MCVLFLTSIKYVLILSNIKYCVLILSNIKYVCFVFNEHKICFNFI